MPSIGDNARIIQSGKVKSAKALKALVTITCAATTCTESVTKEGNFCSVACCVTPALAVPLVAMFTPEPVLTPIEAFFQACQHADWHFAYSDDSAMWKRGKAQIEGLEAQAKADASLTPIYEAWKAHFYAKGERPTLVQFTNPIAEEATQMTDHQSPCGDKTCIDAECQARVHIRKHLLENMSEQERIKHSAPIIAALQALLADPVYMTADPEALAAQAIETGVQNVREGFLHVQAPKPVLTSTTKAVRKPRTAKVQPRVTDNKEHPVTIRNADDRTYTKAEMEAAVKAAVEAEIAKREAKIKRTKRTAPADKPVEVVANRKGGGRAKIERITAKDREFAGLTLDAIVVAADLTVPALEIGEQSIDTLVPPKVRSPYNKARYRLDAKPLVLDGETCTYRVLMAEHERIAGLVKAKPVKQATVAGAVADEKATKVAAKVDTTAKAAKKAKVKALMTVMGISKAEAQALIG